MKTKILLIILSITTALQTCGEEPKGFVPVMPDQKIRTFAHDFDTVWGGILTILETRDIDIDVINKEKGLIITDFIPIHTDSELGKSVIFPEKGEKIIHLAKYDMTIVVTVSGDSGTSVEVNVHLSKYSRSLMTYYSWKDQLSNGFIEQQLFDELARMLK